MLLQALFGLFLGGEKVHSNTAGFSIWRVFEGRLKLLISHVTLLSETMCLQSADCMLIAEVGRGERHVQPTLGYAHFSVRKQF